MKEEQDKSTPPLAMGDAGKSYWQKWYLALLVFLLMQIVFYYLLTQHFK